MDLLSLKDFRSKLRPRNLVCAADLRRALDVRRRDAIAVMTPEFLGSPLRHFVQSFNVEKKKAFPDRETCARLLGSVPANTVEADLKFIQTTFLRLTTSEAKCAFGLAASRIGLSMVSFVKTLYIFRGQINSCVELAALFSKAPRRLNVEVQRKPETIQYAVPVIRTRIEKVFVPVTSIVEFHRPAIVVEQPHTVIRHEIVAKPRATSVVPRAIVECIVAHMRLPTVRVSTNEPPAVESPINPPVDPRPVVNLRLPDMSNGDYDRPTRKEYIDMFVMGTRMFLVADNAVESVPINGPEFAKCESWAIPTFGFRTTKVAKQIADLYVAKQGLTFRVPKRWATIAYDLETYNADPTNEGVPKPADTEGAFIGIIGISIATFDGKALRFAILDASKGTPEMIARVRGTLSNDGINVIPCRVQMEMVVQFLEIVWMIAAKYEIVNMLSFNGSSSNRKVGSGDDASMFDPKMGAFVCGYDLPFLVHRIGLKNAFRSIMTSAYKGAVGASSLAAQVAICELFGPRVHFFDLDEALCSQEVALVKFGKMKRVESRRLNDFLKAFDLEQKDDVSARLIGKSLREFCDDNYAYEKIVRYCLRDCDALHDLNRKLSFIPDILATQEFTGLPFSTVAHRTQAQRVSAYVMRRIHVETDEYLRMYSRKDMVSFVSNASRHGKKPAEIEAKLREHHCCETIADLLSPSRSFTGATNIDRTRAVLADGTVLSQDFESLYPSLMLLFNITPFNFKGICDTPDASDRDHIYLESDLTINGGERFTDPKFKVAPRDTLVYDKFVFGEELMCPQDAAELRQLDRELLAATGNPAAVAVLKTECRKACDAARKSGADKDAVAAIKAEFAAQILDLHADKKLAAELMALRCGVEQRCRRYAKFERIKPGDKTPASVFLDCIATLKSRRAADKRARDIAGERRRLMVCALIGQQPAIGDYAALAKYGESLAAVADDHDYKCRLSALTSSAEYKALGDAWAINEARQNATKVLANSLYGNLSSDTSPLKLSAFPGACVTMMGRLAHYLAFDAIQNVLDARTVYGDTDSEMYCAPWFPQLGHPDIYRPENAHLLAVAKSPDGSLLDANQFLAWARGTADKVNVYIRNEIAGRYPCVGGNVDLLRMAFEMDKTMMRAFFPKQKKAYLYLQFSLAKRKATLKTSGIQLAQMTANCEARLLGFIERALRANPCEIGSMMSQFVHEEYASIGVRPTENGLLFKDNDAINVSIRQRFPKYKSSDEKLLVVRCVGIAKAAKDSWLPVAELGGASVDVPKMFELIYGKNLMRFWPAELKAALTAENASIGAKPPVVYAETKLAPHEEDEPENILIRREYARGTTCHRKCPRFYSIEAAANLIKAPDAAFSAHEVIRSVMRMTFDVDLHGANDASFRRVLAAIHSAVSEAATLSVQPIVLTAHGATKRSAHVFYPIAVQREFNAEVAKYAARELGQLGDAIDCGIYTAGHSLRLPICNKVSPVGEIERRPLLVNGSLDETLACLDQCFMGNLVDGAGKPLPKITSLFGLPHAVDASIRGPFTRYAEESNVTGYKEIPPSFVEAIAPLYGPTVVASDFRTKVATNGTGAIDHFDVQCQRKEIACPWCGHPHVNQWVKVYRDGKNWFATCYNVLLQATKNAQRDPLSLGPEVNKKASIAAILEGAVGHIKANRIAAPVQDLKGQQYVSFDCRKADVTAVCASLGSGKSGCIERTAEFYESILKPSPRRSLTSEDKTRFREQGFEDYREIAEREIDFAIHKHLVLQIDSLERLSLGDGIPPDLFLNDEAMALMLQLYSAARVKTQIAEVFVRLVQNAKHVALLDGYLSERVTEMIMRIRGFGRSIEPTVQRITFNAMPYAGKTFGIRVGDPLRKREVCRMMADEIIMMADKGNVFMFCAQVKLANVLARLLKDAGKTVLMYNGRDLDVDENGDSMYKRKYEDLAHIRERLSAEKPNVLIYTSTITVGIDIRDCAGYEFASEYHFLSPCVSAYDQIQALRRVRHTTSGRAVLFFSTSAFNGECGKTMASEIYKFSHDPMSATLGQQLLAAIGEAAGQVARTWWTLICDALWLAGAQFEWLGKYVWTRPKEELPDVSPLKEDIGQTLAEHKLTEEECALFDSMYAQRREHETKMKLKGQGLEVAKVKFHIKSRFKLTVDEVNELDADECLAAQRVRKLNADQGLGFEIANEADFGAKRGRLLLVASAFQEYCGESGFEPQPIDPVAVRKRARSTLTDEIAKSCIARSLLVRNGIITARDAKLPHAREADQRARQLSELIAAVRKLACKDGSVGGLIACDAFRSECGRLHMTYQFGGILLATYGIVLSKYSASMYEVRNLSDLESRPIGDLIAAAYEKNDERAAYPMMFRHGETTMSANDVTEEWLRGKLMPADCKNIDIGRRAFVLIVGAFLTYNAEDATAIRERVLGIIHDPGLDTAGLLKGLYEMRKASPLPESLRKFIYTKPTEVASVETAKSAKKARAKAPIDISGYKVEDYIARAYAIVESGTIKAVDLDVPIFCCGARFEELRRATIFKRDGNWFYRGCEKGRGVGGVPVMHTYDFPYVGPIGGDVAAALLVLTRALFAGKIPLSTGKKRGRKPDVSGPKYSNVIQNAYKAAKEGAAKSVKTPRIAAGELVARYVIAQRGEIERPSLIEELRCLVIHKKVNNNAVANYWPYQNVVMANSRRLEVAGPKKFEDSLLREQENPEAIADALLAIKGARLA